MSHFMNDRSTVLSIWRSVGPNYLLSRAFMPIWNAFLYVILILECVRFKLIFNIALHQPNPVVTMLKFLGLWLPLYVAIGMQLALFVGLMFGLAQISKTRELDALHAVGVGLHQLMLPIASLGVGVGLLSFLIVGWIQPLSLYASKSFLHDLEQSANILLADTNLFFIKDRKTVMLDEISSDGSEFERVFIYETHPDGKTVTSSGTSGRLLSDGGFNNLHYFVHAVDVMEIAKNPKATNATLSKKSTTTSLVNVAGPLEKTEKQPYRSRGLSEYEWTLSELFAGEQGRPAYIEPHKLNAEMNYRLAQMLFILLMPFLAAITVIEPRRNPGPARFFIGVVIVLGFYQYLNYGTSISRNNILPPMITLWVPLGVMYAVVLTQFWKLAYRPTFR
jgi:lipopolysaccharide export system permease protein